MAVAPRPARRSPPEPHVAADPRPETAAPDATRSTPARGAFGISAPAPGGFGAVVHGDVRTFDARQAAEIRAAVYEHKLVMLPGQSLSNAEYIAFARVLGEPQIYFQPNYHHPDHPEIFVSSNVPHDGRKVGVAGTGRYWHSDYQFFPEPLPLTMIQPIVVSANNRSTFYIDMQQVLADLPDELAELVRDRRCLHEAKWRYKIQPSDVDKSITEILEEFGAETPTVSHPAVMTHPVNGRELLYVSRGFTVGVEGFGVEAGRARLNELFDFIEQERYWRRVPWELGTLLLWDNRQVIHMASDVPPGEKSESYRIGVYDGLDFCADEPRGRIVGDAR